MKKSHKFLIILLLVLCGRYNSYAQAGAANIGFNFSLGEKTIDGAEVYPSAKKVNGVFVQNTEKGAPTSGSSYTLTIQRHTGTKLFSETKAYPSNQGTSFSTGLTFRVSLPATVTAKYLNDSCTTTIICKPPAGYNKTISIGYGVMMGGKIRTTQTEPVSFSPGQLEYSGIRWQ